MQVRPHLKVWILLSIFGVEVLLLIGLLGYQAFLFLENLPQTYYDHTRNAATPERAVEELIRKQDKRYPEIYGRYETEIGPVVFYKKPPFSRPQCYARPKPDNRGWKLSDADNHCVLLNREPSGPYWFCATDVDMDIGIVPIFGRVTCGIASTIEFHLNTGEIIHAELTSNFFLVYPKQSGLSVKDYLANGIQGNAIPPEGQLILRDNTGQIVLQGSIQDLCNNRS